MMKLFATILASIALTVSAGVVGPNDEKFCTLDASLIFVVDGSASVSDANFQKSKEFVSNFATAFKNQAGFKMGLVQFSDTTKVETSLTSNMDTVVTNANAMTQLKGNTNSRLGYTTGAQQLTGVSSDTKKFIVFMTDGKTDGGWVAALSQMVNYTAPDDTFYRGVASQGIQVIPFGVGTDYSMEEFKTMTGNDASFIVESSFDAMKKTISKFKTLACTAETECIGECSKKTKAVGTAGSHYVFKNNLCDAKYAVTSDKCVIVYGSTTVKNPSKTNTYEFTDTGTDISLYKTYDKLTCGTKPNMHFSVFPCDASAKPQPKITVAATEDQACTIANLTSSIEFAKAYLKPNKMNVCFDNWNWDTEFCAKKHAAKVKYALSNNTLERTPLPNIDAYATCNDTQCCFNVKEGFQGQSAYVFAYFDGEMTPETSKASDQFDIIRCSDLGVEGKFQHHFYVDVPIDEVKALTIKVSPTYVLDTILSVTLKSFRKIVGYDTFESIRVQNRKEKKDPADYYNVTVSMLVRRYAISQCDDHIVKSAVVTGLAGAIDKGFPYDEPTDPLGGKKIGL